MVRLGGLEARDGVRRSGFDGTDSRVAEVVVASGSIHKEKTSKSSGKRKQSMK